MTTLLLSWREVKGRWVSASKMSRHRSIILYFRNQTEITTKMYSSVDDGDESEDVVAG